MRVRFVTEDDMDDDHECTCGDCHNEAQKLPEQAIQAECMKYALAAFQQSCTKEVGQLLVFKRGVHSGLSHFPKDTMFVIAKVFDPPKMCEEDSHNTSFGREHDLGLLAYNKDGSALWICMDSRFFEDYVPVA